MVKRLQKLVQYIQRYSMKYADPQHEHSTQFRLAGSLPKLLDRSHQNFTHTVALVALFNHARTRRYSIPFLNARATKVGNLPFFAQI